MRLLDRYLLRELLVPLGYCLIGFIILWLAYNLFNELDDLQDLKLHAGDIAEYYWVRWPEFLPMVMPMSLLLALLYTLTNHARHHEITAMRAAGVSIWRLAAPYFAVGAAASVVLFAVNELWISDIPERAERIKERRTAAPKNPSERHLEHNLAFINSRDGHEWHAAVYNRRTAQMTNPRVNWTLPDGSRRWLFAERAVYTKGAWVFLNVHEYRDAAGTNAPPVPVSQTNVLPMPEFTETPEQINIEIKMSQRLSLRNVHAQDIPLMEILEYLRFHPKPARDIRFLLYTRLHERLAAPWSCLVVVLIAIPFGAASGRRNVFAGVAGSVFLCFAFFVLSQMGEALGSKGIVAPWLGAWLPNLVFGSVGAWMTARVR